MKKLLLLILILSASNLYAQNLARFSKTEMYADFDTLTANIKVISPHVAIKKDLWHYNALKQIKTLRRNIDTITSAYSFNLLINRALISCQDYHTSVMQMPDAYYKVGSAFQLYLPVSYIDGKYIVGKSFRVNGKIVVAGSEITRVNNKIIDNYIAGLKSDKTLSYDLVKGKFYSESFYKNEQSLRSDRIKFTVNSKEGLVSEITMNTKERADFVIPIKDTIKNQVDYWADKQVLYIKIFRMDEALIPMFQRKIAKFRNNNGSINRIIIDIRDNSGGSDMVWQSVYAAILPRKTYYPLIIDGYYPQFMSREYLKNIDIKTDSAKKDQNSLLKKYKLYTYLKTNWIITPTDSSINFGGKIIVIGNENIYSSGASAMLLPNARKDDSVYSVGRKTGMFLGGGYSPIVLTLPNSKIPYRIEPGMDVTNIKSRQDLMHDNYEYIIPCTFEEIFNKERFQGNLLGKIYLENFDPFIKKALEL